ncbi:Bug family tripartite tricarboxylate transporter substrate binding protein [Crenalkalicoccus roseus]|uniref:Bug family tripartite tricarboxylate transporter substrate binding protein n=1 Tax=Crenalkalicoccus roseus TaxID=1485588 RepID=UPI0010807FD9|nr:tripartite tricarboxylate transporter substrate-binding protein [Crenalkalicoccus roseus]
MNRRGLLGLAAAATLARPAPAQPAFPQRPVRLVVAFPAGGPTDVIARIIAERMARDLGQPVVVENRGGANGNIAAEAVSRADPDGHTLLYNTSSIAISQALYRRLGYDLARDLAPVALTAAAPALLVVNPAVPAQDPQGFVAWARANSGRISYGSGGVGNISHLVAFMVLRHIGAEATHVPYRGTAAALTDTAAGNVQFMADALNTALPLAQDGRVRAIAVSTRARSPLLPEVPTMAEAGMMPPDFDVGIWQGMMVPARTPAPVVARLNAAANAALADAEVKARLAAMGARPTGGTAEDYARYLAAEVALWARVVQESGATAE